MNALLWSFVRIPGSGGPDERSHFGVIEVMVASGELPRFQGYVPEAFADGPVRAQVAYELTPNFTAIPIALIIGLLGYDDYAFNVHIARLFIVALYPVTLTFAFLLMRRVFPGFPIATIWGLTVMCTVPMFTLVHSYYTNDAPAIAASTVAVYALVRAFQSDFEIRHTLLLGVTLALVALHKYTGFVVFPATILLIVWHLYRRPGHMLRALATALGTALILSSWWYIRNWLLYGDPIGVYYTQAAVDATGGAPVPPMARGLTPTEFLAETNWLPENYATFWAGYGQQRLKLHAAAYLALLSMLALVAVGLTTRFIRWSFGPRDPDMRVIATMALMHIGLWLISFWSSYSVDVALHGRYIFPTFTAFMILTITGLSELLRHTKAPSTLALATIPIMLAANGAYFIHSVLPDVVY